MLLIIDNYDSFTYNLVHYLGGLGTVAQVHRNDVLTVRDALALKPQAIVLSPGPGMPNSAGICTKLVQEAPPDLPILGVCLGHQAIGEAFGGKIIRAPEIMHGKLSALYHENSGLFADLPQGFVATRYHSLMIEPASLPNCLQVSCWTKGRDIIMGVTHKKQPIFGIQAHPESIATEYGKQILANFLTIAGFSPNLRTSNR